MDAEHVAPALAAYEDIRRVDVARIQNAARNAMEWFEVVGRRYADTMAPEQFFYSMLTRSQRISHENLRLRDPHWLEGYERWFARRAGAPAPDGERALPADAHSVSCPRPVARQSHCRVSDGDVFGERRTDRRFPYRAFGRSRDGRRGPCVRRDDLRVARSAHHSGLSRPLERCAAAAMEAAC